VTIETLEENWNLYLAAYRAQAEHDRERLLKQCVSEDIVFTNPGGDGKTRSGLSVHIGKFQKGNPGAYFNTEKLYVQTDKLLAIWSMHRADGTTVTTGYNFVQPADDGRFNYMAGFF
jgi:ketosteroid isomerase-like protein